MEEDGSGGGASSVWAPKPDVHPQKIDEPYSVESWRTTTARSASSGSSSTIFWKDLVRKPSRDAAWAGEDPYA